MSITKFREIVDRIAGDLVQWTKATENRWLDVDTTSCRRPWCRGFTRHGLYHVFHHFLEAS